MSRGNIKGMVEVLKLLPMHMHTGQCVSHNNGCKYIQDKVSLQYKWLYMFTVIYIDSCIEFSLRKGSEFRAKSQPIDKRSLNLYYTQLQKKVYNLSFGG